MSAFKMMTTLGSVLSTRAFSKIHFSVQNIQIFSGRFSRLKDAILAGGIDVVFDDKRLREEKASAMYVSTASSNAFYFTTAFEKKKTLNIDEQGTLAHECVHAAFDMDYIDNMSKIDEESCAYLIAGLYTYFNFGKQRYKKNGPVHKLCLALEDYPGLELTTNENYQAIFNAVGKVYSKGHSPEWAKKSYIRNGI